MLVQQYSEGRLLLALFSYVRANDPSVVSSYEWSAAQFEEIQLHVMSALCTLCPLLLDDHMACQGNTRILLLIEWCIAAGSCSEHCQNLQFCLTVWCSVNINYNNGNNINNSVRLFE